MNRKQVEPTTVYIEPTTRCNLRCEMCVKQAPGNEIAEGDFSLNLMDTLTPLAGKLDRVIFSGIGEPLLHNGLEKMISLSHRLLNSNGTIGVQTNGTLLKAERIKSLLNAGLNELCISLDSVNPDIFSSVRSGGELESIAKAFTELNSVVSGRKDSFRFGIESVVMKQNLENLPDVVRWAANNGSAFVIVSHLLPYQRSMESQSLNSPNLASSSELYRRYKISGEEQGVNLDQYLKQRWRYHWNVSKSSEEKKLMALGQDFIEEAYAKDIPLHYKNLIAEDEVGLARAKAVFAETKEIADETGLELTLPELSPRSQRHCHFVEEGSLFISWDGSVYPCYFLWHRYAFYQNGQQVKVTPLSLGKLGEQHLYAIWHNQDFVQFRDNVLHYDYPFCGNCNLGPCNLFTAKTFEFDCYVKRVPCGVCPWCGGLLHCLH